MTTTRNYIPYRSFDPAEIPYALGPGLIQSLTDVREPTTDSTSSPVPGQGSTAATEAIRPTSQGSRRDLGVLRFRLGEVQCEGVI